MRRRRGDECAVDLSSFDGPAVAGANLNGPDDDDRVVECDRTPASCLDGAFPRSGRGPQDVTHQCPHTAAFNKNLRSVFRPTRSTHVVYRITGPSFKKLLAMMLIKPAPVTTSDAGCSDTSRSWRFLLRLSSLPLRRTQRT